MGVEAKVEVIAQHNVQEAAAGEVEVDFKTALVAVGVEEKVEARAWPNVEAGTSLLKRRGSWTTNPAVLKGAIASATLLYACSAFLIYLGLRLINEILKCRSTKGLLEDRRE